MSDTPVAVVTGGAREGGIGEACQNELTNRGYRVVAADIEFVEADGESDRFGLDLASEVAIVDFCAKVAGRYGRVDLLVNNAGLHPKNDGQKITIAETTTDQWNLILAVNLTAPFLLFREFLPLLSESGAGRVVNIASRAGRTASPIAAAHYSASKSGLIGLSRIMAVEGAQAGITVNCVAPGPVLTPISTKLQDVRDRIAKTIPVGRYGRPEEVAAAVGFLASREASFITGAIIDANGGSFMP
ncbi:SDR family NAD(P)-dependent oxidoreductase [Oceanicola sp. 502str15]|uniref:SDR family NAD(P)-dependent oxidoreductase n=1 Tax=Oceanicola sp. 502str15 TaxID=2696061 RepID=UPI00209534FE|nr:SDR family oxidoreductase [Oceanicola sp. 502str15]MCO6385291.1 SDR family oxidoreductase [Oceanicola sp. 502str15]